jgi:hypothetical protein
MARKQQGNSLMIKKILTAAALSFALVSAAWALPAAPKTELPALSHSDVIQVGKKSHGHYGKGKHYNRKHYNYKYKYRGPKHYGRYYHGGRYWGRRYYYRPYNWQALGCIVVGPVWYCP